MTKEQHERASILIPEIDKLKLIVGVLEFNKDEVIRLSSKTMKFSIEVPPELVMPGVIDYYQKLLLAKQCELERL
jgi:hypothetical protein